MIGGSRSDNPGWPTILVVSLAHFCLFADRALPSALAPALRLRFDLSDTQLGALIGTAMIIPYAIATLLAGHFLGRYSPYRLMALSILAWTAAAATGALAGNYGELIGARIAFGLAQAAFAPAALALLATAVRPAAPIATSIFSTGSAAGRSGGLLIGGLLLLLAAMVTLPGGPAPWRLASLFLLIPNFALAAVLLVMARRNDRPVVGPSGLGSAMSRMARAPRAFIGHFAASAGAVIIAQAGGAWAPSLLNRRFDFDTAQSAIIFGLIVLVAAPAGHISAGHIAARPDFIRRGPAAGMAAGAVGAWLCCMLLVTTSGLTMTIMGLAGLVAAGGFAAATSLIGVSPLLASGNRLAAMSLFFAATTLVGYGVGPLLTGLLSDYMGAQARELAVALTIVVGGSALIVCLAGIWSRSSWRAAARDVDVGCGA